MKRRPLLLLLGFLAFDAATIPTTMTTGYVMKSAWRIDVVPGVDMLPDQTLHGGLRRARRWIQAHRLA
ncbi:hypothetical protein M0638_07645 [Roseomonas sp. NAR14]|uniref:Uncharacterized protein n=1 Tax=Roseomonas acroporae TaxID=2937791 RepID=A0A9X1Y4V2_9PROT|nr:hypothetical protein [Roseomonas acroporae]MCK8784249.1 hypothetical protein [Roseomonas acroporae]